MTTPTPTTIPAPTPPAPAPTATPQAKMSVDDFANAIKQKYPAYQNVDNATLTQKIIAKYPVYANQVDINDLGGGPAAGGDQTPAPTADEQSAAQFNPTFASKTTDSPVVAAAKTVGNIPSSVFGVAVNTLKSLNPVPIFQAGEGLATDKAAEAQGNQNVADENNKLVQQYQAMKLQGKDTSHIEAFAKQQGIDLGKIQTPAPTPSAFGSVISSVPGATTKVAGGLVPDVVKAGGNVVQGAFTGNQAQIDTNLQRAQRDVVNDPFGQIAPIIAAGEAGAKGVDAFTGDLAKNKMADYVSNIDENIKNNEPIPTGKGTNLSGAFDSGISKIASPVTKAGDYIFGKAGDVINSMKTPAPSATDVSGKILQGTTDDAELGAKVLPGVDTKGVKSYEDLSSTLDKKINSNLGKVDEAFQSSTDKVKMRDLNKTVEADVGGTKVKASINYVKEALGNLKELYTKTKDPAEALRIKALITKATTEGLTPNEINILSREYGTEFGSKAFDKMGNPLTSTNARAYENIRSGLKDTARSFLKDDEAKALDANTSDLIKTKKLVDKMVEKVNALNQRITQRGLVEKIGRAVGKTVDVATMGGIKSFVQKLFFPSNVGLKTMNSLDLQAELSKNLNIVSGLQNAPENIVIRTIQNLASKSAEGIKAGAKAVNQLPEK